LLLDAFTGSRQLARLGLVEPHERYRRLWQFPLAVLEVVRTLRFLVTIPTEIDGHSFALRFVSGPQRNALANGKLLFHDAFYPFDTGPLRTAMGYEDWLPEGLQLALPPDYEKVKLIEGRFVLSGV
jgi:hypothetical protein